MWKRVVAPTILVSILWVAASLITSYHLQQVHDLHVRTLTENVTTIESAWAMRRDIWKLQSQVVEGAANARAGDPASQAVDQSIPDLIAGFGRSLAEAQATSLTPGEQALVAEIRTRFDAYRRHVEARDLAPARSDGISAAQKGIKYTEQAATLASAVADSARRLIEVNQDLIHGQLAEDARLRADLRRARIAFLIAGPLLGLAFGWTVARGLSRSLSRISITLEGAVGGADGRLGSVSVSTPDDLPKLQQQAHIVTERIRNVVEELEVARHELVQSERLAAVGELAAGVAHEIRNPLTSVKLLIQAAAGRQSNPALTSREFEVVIGEILRMEHTIQGLLDFARPPRPRRARHDLRDTLRRALRLVQGRADQQRVRIIERFPGADVIVDADPDQLHTVFVNLAINSIEAMPRGGELDVALEGGTISTIHFSDTGQGIPAEVMSRLFEPFVTGKEHGTGLGLAISRRVIEEHGGKIFAINRPESGARLTVELPAVGQAADELVLHDARTAAGVSSPAERIDRTINVA